LGLGAVEAVTGRRELAALAEHFRRAGHSNQRRHSDSAGRCWLPEWLVSSCSRAIQVHWRRRHGLPCRWLVIRCECAVRLSPGTRYTLPCLLPSGWLRAISAPVIISIDMMTQNSLSLSPQPYGAFLSLSHFGSQRRHLALNGLRGARVLFLQKRLAAAASFD
jgi:hypothetical protein